MVFLSAVCGGSVDVPRVYPDANGNLPVKDGEYGKHPDGTWRGKTPNGHYVRLDSRWKVVEHKDETITVTPSIHITVDDRKGNTHELWHGWLTDGVWKSV